MKTTKLAVLNAVFSAAVSPTIPDLKKIVFVCVQHLLDTSIELFKTLIALGVIPNNIFLTGKLYSTGDMVVRELKNLGIQLQTSTPFTILGDYAPTFNQDIVSMWKKVERHIRNYKINRIVVLDDGGKCLASIPNDMLTQWIVIGIEQTTSGLLNPTVINLPIPFIDVASSAAKLQLESNLIAETVLEKLVKTLSVLKRGSPCGVIGIGAIGKNVSKHLISLGYPVYTYEKNPSYQNKIKGSIPCNSLEELIQQSDYVFGCTGRDVTTQLQFIEQLDRDKVFISCSSEDKEFLTLLKWIQAARGDSIHCNPLENITWQLSNGVHIHILRGGFPITFDNSGVGAPANKIQLTAGLLFCALIQAITLICDPIDANIKGRVMLSPFAQRFVANIWRKFNPSYFVSPQLTHNFNHIDWIIKNSGGTFYDLSLMKNYFSVKDSCEIVT